MRTAIQIFAIGLSKGAVYALVALGITLIYRTTRILNFAQGQILMVAVFISLSLMGLGSVPMPIAWLVGIAFAVLLGLLVDLAVRPTLPGKLVIDWVDWAVLPLILAIAGLFFGARRGVATSDLSVIVTGGIVGLAIGVGSGLAIVLLLRLFGTRVSTGDSSLGWILATVAIATIIQFVAPYIWPPQDQQYASPFPNDRGIPGLPGPLQELLSQRQVFTIVVAFLLVIAVDLLYNKTKLGRAMRAVATDRDTAALMGISAKWTIRWAFILASALAAVGGFLVAPLTFANIAMGFDLGVKGFIAAVLGGIDSARGAIAGGFILGIFEAALPQVLDAVNPTLGKFPEPFVFALFILVLVFRPQGVFGTSIREAR